jgi:uncharacterized protein (DUF1499 family)
MTRPRNLGFRDGRFSPPSWKPNCVSSTTDSRSDARHYVLPLMFEGDPAAAWRHLRTVVDALPRTVVINADDHYLHAECSSRMFGFVDDLQAALVTEQRVIHIKSGARVGIRDFGVNRARVEAIRMALAALIG